MFHWEKISFRRLNLNVPNGCFPPKYTVSTSLLASLLEQVGSFETANVALEIGCGVGALTLIVARRGIYTIGIDISEKCVASAVRNSRDNFLDAFTDFVVCESGKCIRDNSIDICFSNPPYLPITPRDIVDYSFAGGNSLEILLDILENCEKIAKKDGCILLAINDIALKSLKLEKFKKAAYHKSPFDTVYILKKCG